MRKTAALLVSVLGCAFLGMVLFMEWDPDDFSGMDTYATVLVHPYQTLVPIEFFVAITTIGSVTGIVILTILALFFLRNERVSAARLLTALVGTSACVQVVKMVVERARPEALPWIGSMHSFSFPSGHAGSAMALFGSVGVLLYLRAKTKRSKSIYALIFIGLIVLIGMSRVVLSVHYFSDVLAGYVLGAFWVALAFSLPASVFKRRHAIGEHAVD